MNTTYTAKDIEVLEGLEPVRKRPSMYIGGVDSHGYHHLLWEVVDNSVDEAINGYAKKIEVVLDADLMGATVTDDGRGIPVDMHPKFKRSALELVLCTLHSGGKFGNSSYHVAGGLHGVGDSVVNALSGELTATVRRDGREYTQSYRRGDPTTKLVKGESTNKHGTTVHFRPDPQIFGDKLKFDAELVRERLEAKSYLHKGLRIVFLDRATGDQVEFDHPGGINDYLVKLVGDKKKPSVHPQPFFFERANGHSRVEIALQWTEATDETIRTYANGIPTGSGGTHESGFKQGLVKAIRGYMVSKNLSPKGAAFHQNILEFR